MAVLGGVTLTVNRGLVQRNELDPSRFFQWTSTIVADASAGALLGICDVPTGFAVLWLAISAQVGGASTSNVQYLLTEGGAITLTHAEEDFLVDGGARFRGWAPPPVFYTGDVLAARASVDNILADDLTVFAQAYGWDQQVARNLPQRFFWPGTLR